MSLYLKIRYWCRDTYCVWVAKRAIRKLQKQQYKRLKGEILTWFVIGKISVEVWNALLPQEQAIRVAVMANEFIEMQSCSKIVIDIDEGDDEVTFSAQCEEVSL